MQNLGQNVEAAPNLLNLETAEGLQAFENNKRVLSSFSKQTEDNLLGIIQSRGDKLERPSGFKWIKQWHNNQDLEPVMRALAKTYNTSRAVYEENMSNFQQEIFNTEKGLERTIEDEEDLIDSFLTAKKSMEEFREIVEETDVVKNSYTYRYGTKPDMTMSRLISFVRSFFKRNPHKAYPAQNSVLENFTRLCPTGKDKLTEIDTAWMYSVWETLQANRGFLQGVLDAHPAFRNDKNFMLLILRDPRLDTGEKAKRLALFSPTFQRDRDVLAAIGFISVGRQLSKGDREKVRQMNLEQLGKDFNRIEERDPLSNLNASNKGIITRDVRPPRNPQPPAPPAEGG